MIKGGISNSRICLSTNIFFVFVSRSTRKFPQTDIDKLKRGTEGLAITYGFRVWWCLPYLENEDSVCVPVFWNFPVLFLPRM